MEHGRKTVFAVGGLCVFVAVVQVLAHQEFLHDGVMRSPGNDFNDALDYARRATRLATGEGFAAVCADAHRMPGYPAFLAAFHRFFDAPWQAARYAQIALTSLLPALAFVMARSWLPADRWRLLPVAGVAAWPPLYYFSSALTAETPSIVATALLVCLSAACYRRPTAVMAVLSALLIFVITALKPNGILLAVVPLSAVFLGNGNVRVSWRFALVFGLTAALCIAPWTIFASLANERFIPLTTMQGVALCAGSGGIYHVPGDSAAAMLPSLMDRAREALAIDFRCYLENSGLDPGLHPYLQKIALERWRDHPFVTAAYGVAKMLHLLGFSLRGAADYGSAAMSLSAVAAAIWLIRQRALFPFGQLFLIVLALALLQAFVFQPDQRFRVAWVDFTAVWIVGAALGRLLAGKASGNTA